MPGLLKIGISFTWSAKRTTRGLSDSCPCMKRQNKATISPMRSGGLCGFLDLRTPPTWPWLTTRELQRDRRHYGRPLSHHKVSTVISLRPERLRWENSIHNTRTGRSSPTTTHLHNIYHLLVRTDGDIWKGIPSSNVWWCSLWRYRCFSFL